MYILGGIFALLLVLLFMPVRAAFSYDTANAEADSNNDPTRLTIYYAFFRFRIFPPPPKKIKPAKKSETTKISAKATEPKPSYIKRRMDEAGLFGFLGELADLLRLMPHAAHRILKHTKVTRLRLNVKSAGEDAADTAIKTGLLYSAVYPLLGALASIARVYRPQIDIAPDYDSDEEAISFSVSARIRISPIFLIGAGLWFLAKYIGAAKSSRSRAASAKQ